MRDDGPHRRRMHEAYLAHLEETSAPYVVVSGPHAERMRTAIAAVDELLGAGRGAAARPSPSASRRWRAFSTA